MMLESEALALESTQVGRRAADFLALTKPRVVGMVLVTTVVGYYLGVTTAPLDLPRVLATLLGTALAAGGTLALNQFMERDLDGRMERTRERPLPDGRIAPTDALVFGAALVILGTTELAVAVDTLPALVTVATTASYLFLYTPLKRRTPLCSVIGAVPGALPPLTGWAAARGTLGPDAWIIFAIMFLWQIPHALAIACLYREDYARAGIRLLPVVESDGASTRRQIVSHALALLEVATMPTLVGMTGTVYFCVSLLLGLGLLASALRMAYSATVPDARRLMFATLLYLPVLLMTMAADKMPVAPW